MKAFLIALGLLFIALKLTEHVDWSWWLVLLPLYLIPAMWTFWVMVGLMLAAAMEDKR